MVGALLILDNSVSAARWLSPQEKQLITSELRQDDKAREHLSLLKIFADARIWKIILTGFPAMMGLYVLGFYLPTLIKASGVTTSTTVGMLSAIPYLVAVVAMVAFGRSSDRMRERRWHLATVLLLGAAGLTASVWASHSAVLTVITMSIAAAGIIS